MVRIHRDFNLKMFLAQITHRLLLLLLIYKANFELFEILFLENLFKPCKEES